MSTAEGRVSPVTSQGHHTRRMSWRTKDWGYAAILASNIVAATIGLGVENQLQSELCAETGNRKCVETIARVW